MVSQRQLFSKIFILITILIIGLPGLKIYWMLLDDGHDVEFARNLSNSISTLNFSTFINQILEIGGRFRPVYWVYKMLLFDIGGGIPGFYRLIHVAVFGLIAYYLYLFVVKVGKSEFAGLLASLLWLTTTINVENWLRVGPQEPLLTLFSLLTFYFLLVRKNFNWAIFFSFLTIFSKENGIAIIPALGLLTFFNYKNKNIKKAEFLKVFKYSLLFLGILVLITYFRHTGYSTNYYFLFKMIVENIRLLFSEIFNEFTFYIIPAFIIFVYLLLRRGSSVHNAETIKSSLVTIVTFFSFLIIQSPWKYVLTRYLMPESVFMCLFIGINISVLAKVIANVKMNFYFRNIGKLFLFMFLVTYFFFKIFVIYDRTLRTVYETNLIKQVTSYLSENVPSNGNVYMNLSDEEATNEYIVEMDLHLKEFWNRGDINVIYLPKSGEMDGIIVDSNIGKKYLESDILIKQYGLDGGKTFVSSGDISIFTTPIGFVGQIFKKSLSYLTQRRPFNFDGIYTNYHFQSEWKIYHVKKI